MKKKILIIEDDPFILKMYETKLKNSGYIALKATTGKQGIDMAKQKKPDIIILDLVLPEMDGFKVLKLLKTDSATKDILVLVLSNLGQKNNVDKAMKLGAAAYMIKSEFKPSEVVARIQELLNNKKI